MGFKAIPWTWRSDWVGVKIWGVGIGGLRLGFGIGGLGLGVWDWGLGLGVWDWGFEIGGLGLFFFNLAKP